jgi:hypothetical protein
MGRAKLVREAVDWAVKHGEPIVDDIIEAFSANRAPRPRQKPKIGFDNPGGDWLKYQRKNASESRNPVSGAVTAYTRKPVMLDPKKVRKIQGHNNERRVPGDMQYDALRPSVEKQGLYPDSPILIGVNYRGDPYIIEGNTRTAVADDLGLSELPAEVRWFAGGEETPEAMLRPDNIEEFMAQSELMRDPRFQKYFAGSQAVDKYGEPLRLYTGTSKDVDFKSFRIPKNGAWFARDPAEASEYALQNDSMDWKPDPNGRNPWSVMETNRASRVMPVYLNIQNPVRFLDPSEFHQAVSDMSGENYKRGQGVLFDRLRSQGHDSAILGNDEVFVVLQDPTQVKSAIGNRGTYDPKEKDMNKARGGLAVKPIWDKKRPKDLGEPKSLSVKKKKSAKARAAAAGRPYPNLIDNMAAARKKGK